MDVARAFQPEICPVRLDRQVFASLVLVFCRLLGSLEAAKGRRKDRCSVSVGEPRTGVRGCRARLMVLREADNRQGLF
jgi:hypothetical protein